MIWLFVACAPLGWLDGAPVYDLERAARRAPAGAVLRLAPGEHLVRLETRSTLTIDGEGQATLLGPPDARIVHALGPITLRGLHLAGGFAAEGSALLAEAGARLEDVTVAEGRGPTLLRVRGEADLQRVEAESGWPTTRLAVSGGPLALREVGLGPGAEPALHAEVDAAWLEDVRLDDGHWGSSLRAGQLDARRVSGGAALALRADTQLRADALAVTGALVLSAPDVQATDLQADLIYVEADDPSRLSGLRARALGLIGGQAEDVLLSGAAPALSVVDGRLSVAVVQSTAEPVRLALSGARLSEVLVVDAGAGPELPVFQIGGVNELSWFTWLRGERGALLAGEGQLRLTDAVFAELVVADWGPPGAVSAERVSSWAVAPEPPWGLSEPTDAAGAFAGPREAEVRGLWEGLEP